MKLLKSQHISDPPEAHEVRHIRAMGKSVDTKMTWEPCQAEKNRKRGPREKSLNNSDGQFEKNNRNVGKKVNKNKRGNLLIPGKEISIGNVMTVHYFLQYLRSDVSIII